MTGKVQIRQDARRREVLAAAARLYARRGYRATSMNDLAREVGLSKPALYHYVRSKEEVLSELYADVLLDNTAAVARIVDATPDPLDALRAVVVQRVAYTCEHQALLTVFFQEEGHLPPAERDRVLAARRTYDDAVVAIVEHAVAAGRLTLAVRPRIYVNTLIGAANWVYKWYDPAGRLDPAALGEEVAAGLLGPGSGAPPAAGIANGPT